MSSDKFSFPIKNYLSSKLRESDSSINSNSKALRSLLLDPSSVMYQQIFDRIAVLEQNLSVTNYQQMPDYVLDQLAANFNITRQTGSQSYGKIRIYLLERTVVDITASVIATVGGFTYVPLTYSAVPISDLQFDTVFGQYYFDITFMASTSGPDATISKGEVVEISGIPKIASAVVYSNFTSGVAVESNEDLVERMFSSISNNEMLTEASIIKVLQSQFPSLNNVGVVGYGDDYMTRDVVGVSLPLEKLVRLSYCNKVNLPLDSSGEVLWYDALGNLISNPVGGWAGAVYDLSGLDYHALRVSYDSVNYKTVSVQPGFKVRFFDDSGDDLGDYVIVRVEEAVAVPGYAAVKVLRLDRPLKNVGSSSYQYQIIGNVNVNSFHVGGKVDVLVDSTSNEELEVFTIGYSDDPTEGVIEIPLVEGNKEYSTGNNWYESDVGFVQPTLRVLEVAQVSYSDKSLVEVILNPDSDFRVVRKSARSSFSTEEYDVLRIEVRDESGVNPYLNKRLRVTYLTNREISIIQEFVDDPLNKTVDVLIVPPKYVITNIYVDYEGSDLDSSLAQELVSDFLLSKEVGDSIYSSEINDLLLSAGATVVYHPIYIEGLRISDSGERTLVSSSNKLELNRFESAYPAKELSVVNKL